MAKRFTDTDKWKKRFVRELPAQYKLLWLYMLDECDHAGFWIVDFDVARLRLGEEVNEQDALKYLDDKILKIDDGDRWLILDFIDFQYGILNEENRAHNSVIKTLRKYGLWHEDEKIIIRNKPLTSPLQGAKDKEKDKEKDKDKEEDKEKKSELIFPFNGNKFLEKWGHWKHYRKEIKKPIRGVISEQGALRELSQMAETEDHAIKIIDQSIAKGWQGLFKLKEDGKQTTGNGKSGINSQILDNIIDQYVAVKQQDQPN